MPTRSNRGGAVRGRARAAQVKSMNRKSQSGGMIGQPVRAPMSKKRILGAKSPNRLKRSY